jgi:large subunit ribosomal protein L10
MPRPEKVQAVAEIKERIERARAVFLAEYAGLSVKDQQTLRRSLREGGAEFKVVKMTLARRAANELDIEGIDELLLGPTGLTFADEDAVTAAKALKDFAKDHEVFAIKGGLLGTDLLTPERVSELAEIEPREVLLARIAGAFQAPMANMAGLLAAMPRNFASMLLQLVEKTESGEAPAPADADASDDEAPADEAPADEVAAADDAAPDAEDSADDAAEEGDAAPDAEDSADDAAEESDAAPEADATDADVSGDDDDADEPKAADEAEASDADASADDDDDEPADVDAADAEASDDADASEDEEE